MDQRSIFVDVDELSLVLQRIGVLANRHASILQSFWNPDRNTFGLESSKETEDHVTTSCTCVLSFLDAPEFFRERQSEFVDWLLGARWSSEDLPEHNVYTAPIALSALLRVDREALLQPKCVQAVEFLITEVERSDAGGISFEQYPPSGFLTYWTVRSLCDAARLYEEKLWGDRREERRRARRQIERAIAWAEQEVYRQFSYYLAQDDQFDPLQLGYALAIVDLAREEAGKGPDRKAISRGLEILFATQLPNGLWPKGSPIFHYKRLGSVYPFAFETLTAILRIGARGDGLQSQGFAAEFFRPHLEALLRTFSWIESTQLNHPELATHGWRSNLVLPGDTPQAWPTAMVLSFVRGLYVLVHQLIREQLLREFNAAPTSRENVRLTESSWAPITDSQTTLSRTGERVSLKKLVFDRLLVPHLENRGRKIWSTIFYGPPATAKTRLAHHISRVLGWPLITLGTSDFLASGADKMAHQARVIFRKLEKLSEAVVLIDEVEEFVRDRAHTKEPESRLITTAMLTLIQGLRDRESSILILATNYIEEFDNAIKRPGRFDLILFVPPPSFEEKLALLNQDLQLRKLAIEEEAITVLRRRQDLVERFTFYDWTSFLGRMSNRVKQSGSAGVEDGLVADLLDEYSGSLTIDEEDWKRWKGRETIIYD